MAVWGAFGSDFIWEAIWLPLLGVVRGRAAEYMELTSAGWGLLETGAEFSCDELGPAEAADSCGVDLEEPPPNTRRKKPGFGAAGAWGGNSGLREATDGDGAEGSCHDGTGGSSRKALALTNSWAWALMLGPGWLLFFRKVL